jgi:hypothetical protein
MSGKASNNMDETEADAIIVPLIAPTIQNILSHCATVLATGAGISLTVPGDAPAKIAVALIALAFVVWHQFQSWEQKKAAAKSAYSQGALAAGVNIPISFTPNVVSGGHADAVSRPPPATTTPPQLKPSGLSVLSPTNAKAIDSQPNESKLP